MSFSQFKKINEILPEKRRNPTVLPEELQSEIDSFLDAKSLDALADSAKLFSDKRGIVVQRVLPELLKFIAGLPKPVAVSKPPVIDFDNIFQLFAPRGLPEVHLGPRAYLPFERFERKIHVLPDEKKLEKMIKKKGLLLAAGPIDICGNTYHLTPLQLAYGIGNLEACKVILANLDASIAREQLNMFEEPESPELLRRVSFMDHAGRRFEKMTLMEFGYKTCDKYENETSSRYKSENNQSIAYRQLLVKMGTEFTPTNTSELINVMNEEPKKKLLLEAFRVEFAQNEFKNGKPFSLHPLLETLQTLDHAYQDWMKPQRDFFIKEVIGYLLEQVPHCHDETIDPIKQVLSHDNQQLPKLKKSIADLESYIEKIEVGLSEIRLKLKKQPENIFRTSPFS